jgi:hypothetical protein
MECNYKYCRLISVLIIFVSALFVFGDFREFKQFQITKKKYIDVKNRFIVTTRQTKRK